MLFYNASFYSSTGEKISDHLLAVDGKVAGLGKLGELPTESAFELIDLQGGIVLPGLWDCHIHLTETGFSLLQPGLQGVTRLEEMLHRIWHTAQSSKGELVKVGGFDPSLLQDSLPTLAQLDAACRHAPLLLSHVEWHACWLNSRALALTGLESSDGFLTGEANSLARQRLASLITDSDRRMALEAAAKHLTSLGVVGVHALEGGALFSDADYDLLVSVQHDLPLHIFAYHQALDADSQRALAARRVGGCVPLDGSSGVYTAAVSEPYVDWDECGVLYFSQAEVDMFVEKANRLGVQTSLHACGDRAIEQALSAHARHNRPGLRHRIEHVELPSLGQLERLAELGLVASLQPSFDHFWGGDGGDYALTLGRERAKRANPLRSICKAGARVILGSDSPVTPANPLLTLQAALQHKQATERLGFWEALPLLTSEAAWAVHAETSLGELALGRSADFAVYSLPIWDNPDVLAQQKPELTIRQGKIT